MVRGVTLDEAALSSQGQIQETPSCELSVANTEQLGEWKFLAVYHSVHYRALESKGV